MRAEVNRLDFRTAPQTACSLCGAGLPSHSVAGPGDERYCCRGCAHVAEILRTVGAASEAGKRALAAARQHGLISTDDRPGGPVRETPPGTREEMRIRISGMACPSCAWLIESVLSESEGVALAEVDYLSDLARVEIDLSRTSGEKLIREVGRIGYGASRLHESAGPDDRRELLRLALAGFAAMNLMMLAWVGYDIIYRGQPATGEGVVRWVQVMLALPVIGWSALPLYRRAWAALVHGRVVMESLFVLGLAGACGLSVGALASGRPQLYLETATALVAIYLGGRALERALKRRAARSLVNILRFSPNKARLAENGRFVPIDECGEGTTIRVEAGETVPLDLKAESEATVSSGLLTGEPYPAACRPGETVLAGSRVEDGRLTGVVERTASATVAAAMRRRVGEAVRRADSGSRLADRLAQGFVPLVLLVSVASFVGHLAGGAGAVGSLRPAVAVLVVACPCAFGVAASLALSLAVLKLARQGVLVKDPAVLEPLSKIDSAVFDKTGTITRGEMELLRVGWIGRRDDGLLAAVRALEAGSRHPLGVSLSRLLPRDLKVKAEFIIEVPGTGVTGTVDDRRIAAGKLSLFGPLNKPISAPPPWATRIWFGYAGETPSGCLDLADSLRPEARGVIDYLAREGIELRLFSGDSREATETTARAAGIETARGDLTPEEKSAEVAALRSTGRRVLFVGDGYNDAEALAAADVGVALASGADLPMLSSPVVITTRDLRPLPGLIASARRSVRIVRGNIFWAFCYNLAFLPVAAFGLLAPVHAALLMALSSISVALNSMRVLRTPARAARLKTGSVCYES